MTPGEWTDVVREMQARWPSVQIPDASLAVWWDDLRELEADEVRGAVLALYRDGREFPPNGAQILEKASELRRDDPDHGKAWQLVCEANRRFGLHREHGQAQAMTWLADESAAVAEAVLRFGPDALATYDIADEGTVRAQFRGIYLAVVESRRRDLAYAGLPGGRRGELRRGAFAEIAESIEAEG